jgi:hypothetical protein
MRELDKMLVMPKLVHSPIADCDGCAISLQYQSSTISSPKNQKAHLLKRLVMLRVTVSSISAFSPRLGDVL